MPRVFSGNASLLTDDVGLWSRLWEITKVDGTIFRFTDGDTPITFGGNEYVANIGFEASAVLTSAHGKVQGLSIQFIVDSTGLTRADLIGRQYEGQTCTITVVNRDTPDSGSMVLFEGIVGPIALGDNDFVAMSVDGITSKRRYIANQVFTPRCRVDLGDSLCKYAEGLFIIAIAATGVLTLAGQPLNTETVVIDTQTYTFQTVLTNSNGNVLIGATASDSLDNLIAAMNRDAGAGTLYAQLTPLHPTVSALAGIGDTMDVTAKTAGAAGNTIVTTETLTNGSWGGATLSGGQDLTEPPGQLFTVVAPIVNNQTFDTNLTTLLGAGPVPPAIPDPEPLSDNRDNRWDLGLVHWITGNNADISIEVRRSLSLDGEISLYLPAPFVIQVGDTGKIFTGCDKTTTACFNRYDNMVNFRGEPFVASELETNPGNL